MFGNFANIGRAAGYKHDNITHQRKTFDSALIEDNCQCQRNIISLNQNLMLLFLFHFVLLP